MDAWERALIAAGRVEERPATTRFDEALARAARPQQGRLIGAGRQRRPARPNPTYEAGNLPLRTIVAVPPADIILHVRKWGSPQPKQRPRVAQARTDELGQVTSKAHGYTPKETVEAEREWQWVMRAARKVSEPVPAPVGVMAYFEVGGGRADGDNMVKLVLDAMNGTIVADDQQVVQLHVHVARRCARPATTLLVWRC